MSYQILLQKERNMCSQLSIFSFNGRTIHVTNAYWVLALLCAQRSARCPAEPEEGMRGRSPGVCWAPSRGAWLQRARPAPTHPRLQTVDLLWVPPPSVPFRLTRYLCVHLFYPLCQIRETLLLKKAAWTPASAFLLRFLSLRPQPLPPVLPGDKGINRKLFGRKSHRGLSSQGEMCYSLDSVKNHPPARKPNISFLFYSSLVDLKCCVNFCYTAKWCWYTYIYIYKHTYTYIYILFHYDLSWKWKSLSRVWLFATPGSVAHQAPLSMEFPMQKHWSG